MERRDLKHQWEDSRDIDGPTSWMLACLPAMFATRRMFSLDLQGFGSRLQSDFRRKSEDRDMRS